MRAKDALDGSVTTKGKVPTMAKQASQTRQISQAAQSVATAVSQGPIRKRQTRSTADRIADLEEKLAKIKSGDIGRRGRPSSRAEWCSTLFKSNLPAGFMDTKYPDRIENLQQRIEHYNTLEAMQTELDEISSEKGLIESSEQGMRVKALVSDINTEILRFDNLQKSRKNKGQTTV